MKIQMLLAGMNRTEYLIRVRRAHHIYLPELHEGRIEFHDTEHLGMAKAIQAAWSLALEREWDFLYFVEEDMLPLIAPPVTAAAAILDADPTLANIVFKREPWSEYEYQRGDVIAASCDYATAWEDRGTHTRHNHIFSLNPCLIPRWVVELGWPAGNEAEMTATLRGRGYHFAFYGVAGDAPLIRHIGAERAPGWSL